MLLKLSGTKRRIFTIFILVCAVSIILTGCGGEEVDKDNTPNKQEGAEQQSMYTIISEDDLSIDKAVRKEIRAVADVKNKNDIENVLKQITDDYVAEHDVNALVVFLCGRAQDINIGYTLGKCEYAPHGDWSRAAEVKAGNYSKFDYKMDIKDKSNKEEPTDREYEIFDHLNGILNSNENPSKQADYDPLRAEEFEHQAMLKTAEKFSITPEEVDETFLSVMTYLMY